MRERDTHSSKQW